jgi:hypothetical protein
MKKFTFFSALLALCLFVSVPNLKAQYKPSSPLYGSDISVFDYVDCTFAKSHLYVANNGWIYLVARLDAPSINYQAWRVWYSTDNGVSYSQVCEWTYNTDDWVLQDCDMVVTGENASDIRLWVLEATNSGNVNPHNAYVRLNEYDASGALVAQPYYLDYGAAPNEVISCAIATDYRSPGSGMSPFGIGVAYTGNFNSNSWVSYAHSTDGGANFSGTDPFSQTGTDMLGRISISLGATMSLAWGRMAIAFEMDMAGGLGNIGVISSYTDFAVSGWTAPVAVNMTYASSAGKCRYPTIRLQDDKTANSSLGSSYLPILIAYEDWSSGSSNVDIMYSALSTSYVDLTQPVVSDFQSHWLGAGNGNSEGEPSLSFDKAFDNFLLTYTSTQGNTLQYKWTSMNNILTSTWSDWGNYRDNSTPMPYQVQPKVDINPTIGNGACFAWTEESINFPGMQHVLFDAEWSTVGINDQTNKTTSANFLIVPNPAKESTRILVNKSGDYTVTITNMMGQTVLTKAFNGSEVTLTLGEIPAGIYSITLIGESKKEAGKLVVE